MLPIIRILLQHCNSGWGLITVMLLPSSRGNRLIPKTKFAPVPFEIVSLISPAFFAMFRFSLEGFPKFCGFLLVFLQFPITQAEGTHWDAFGCTGALLRGPGTWHRATQTRKRFQWMKMIFFSTNETEKGMQNENVVCFFPLIHGSTYVKSILQHYWKTTSVCSG